MQYIRLLLTHSLRARKPGPRPVTVAHPARRICVFSGQQWAASVSEFVRVDLAVEAMPKGREMLGFPLCARLFLS